MAPSQLSKINGVTNQGFQPNVQSLQSQASRNALVGGSTIAVGSQKSKTMGLGKNNSISLKA